MNILRQVILSLLWTVDLFFIPCGNFINNYVSFYRTSMCEEWCVYGFGVVIMLEFLTGLRALLRPPKKGRQWMRSWRLWREFMPLNMKHNPVIIHRDLKPGMALSIWWYEARITDFGFAKPVTDDHTYGFGVVVLEFLIGLRALDTNRPSEQQILVDWAWTTFSSRKRRSYKR